MARVEIPFIVLTSAGVPVAGANAQVNIRAGGTPATVFAAESGGSTLSNPLTTDSLGRIEGWVDEGSYSIVVSGGTITTYTQQFEANRGDGVGLIANNTVVTQHIQDAQITTAKIADANVTLVKQDAASQQQYPPIGSIIAYTGTTLPTGAQWDWADGGLIDRTTFSNFFTLTGHAYNGGVDPGANKVRKPDRRGRSGVGASNFGAGATTNDNAHVQIARGVSVGEVLHTLIAAEGSVNGSGASGIQSNDHAHSYVACVVNATIDGGSSANVGTAVGTTTGGMNANHSHTLSARTADNGHQTVHPSEASNYLVRVA